ncbi:MAG: response regulator [Prevotella sp.]|nr:response regulator [Prevotella sp.]
MLIVEDNAALLAYERNRLQRHYRVLTATDGAQALRLLSDSNVDVVVSDVMMEPMDGFELCRRVKTDVNTSHIPFILLTALTPRFGQGEGHGERGRQLHRKALLGRLSAQRHPESAALATEHQAGLRHFAIPRAADRLHLEGRRGFHAPPGESDGGALGRQRF